MNFTIEKNGPVVPNVPNKKFFNSVKFAPGGGSKNFKAGDVIKMTAGKVRLRNTVEGGTTATPSKVTFTEANSQWAEKNDIVTCTGPVYAENNDNENHASARVFTMNK